MWCHGSDERPGRFTFPGHLTATVSHVKTFWMWVGVVPPLGSATSSVIWEKHSCLTWTMWAASCLCPRCQSGNQVSGWKVLAVCLCCWYWSRAELDINTTFTCAPWLHLNGLYISLFVFIEAVCESLGHVCANLAAGYQIWSFKTRNYSYVFYFNYRLIQLLVSKENNVLYWEKGRLLPHALRCSSLLQKKDKQNIKLLCSAKNILYSNRLAFHKTHTQGVAVLKHLHLGFWL